MKFKRVLSILIVTVMLIGVLPTMYIANAATYGDLEYEIADGEVTITSCNTSATSVTIPSEIEGYPVTAIGDDAFYLCSSLASVTIGSGVTTIGEWAFYYCKSIVSITIPDSVTAIGEWAFSYCSSLASITIPDSVTSIGKRAFYGCSSLADSDGFVIVRDVLYDYCGSATSITIPDSVTTIGDGAFYNCDSLASITIPDSVTSIGDWAFFNCHNLSSISIPDSVTSIGKRAFYGCWGLADSDEFVIVRDILYDYCGSATSITIPDGVTTIGDWAFFWCESLASITIPDSVTTIGDVAFYWCSNLESITIPDSVTSIGEEAFEGCGITNAVIGNNVTTIAYKTFVNCKNLASISFPDSVTAIDEYAFDECTDLSTVNYGGSEADRGNINIAEGNTYLLNATWNYHEHTYDNACDTDCNVCVKSRTTTHTYGEYVSDNNATTEKDGTKTRVCTVCGAKDTVTDVGSKLPTPEPKPEEKPEEKPVEIKDTTTIFTDVKAKKWYTNAVNYAYSHGFIAGVSDTEFGRDVPVTRGMFITILARIAGVDTSGSANKVQTKFTDVKSGKYYTAAIKWASENGVVNGLTDTTFGPNNAIERQQLCTMIVNFAKYMKIDLKATQTEIKFADATSIRKYAKTAVATCQNAGVVSGYTVDGGTEFKPLNTATRAEAAQILYKFHKDFVA